MRHFKVLPLQTGFTLPEVMIAVGIGSVVMLGIASQIVFSLRSAKSIEKSLAFNNLVTEVSRIATNTTVCSASLLGSHPVANGDVLFTLPDGTQLGAGKSYQGMMTIEELKWVTDPTPTNPKTAYLRMKVDMQSGSSILEQGGQYRYYPKSNGNPPGIMVMMNLDASGNIVTCGGTTEAPPPEFRTGTDKQLCGVHYYLFAKPFPNSCKMIQTNWVTPSGNVGASYMIQSKATTPCDKFGYYAWTTNADGDTTKCDAQDYINYIAIGD